MPYYSAGDYYRGDGNYAAGGIFGAIGKGLKKVAGALFRASPVGRVATAVLPNIIPSGPSFPTITGFAPPPVVPKPGFGGAVERFLPGGESGYMVARRRRMNPLNIKALRRALRRAKGFEKQARRVGSFFQPGKTYRLKGRRPRKRS